MRLYRILLRLTKMLRRVEVELVKGQQDELRPEYGEAELAELLKNGVRGKYVARYRAGTNLMEPAPDVAAAFPTEQAVNDALRGLLQHGKAAA